MSNIQPNSSFVSIGNIGNLRYVGDSGLFLRWPINSGYRNGHSLVIHNQEQAKVATHSLESCYKWFKVYSNKGRQMVRKVE